MVKGGVTVQKVGSLFKRWGHCTKGGVTVQKVGSLYKGGVTVQKVGSLFKKVGSLFKKVGSLFKRWGHCTKGGVTVQSWGLCTCTFTSKKHFVLTSNKNIFNGSTDEYKGQCMKH